MNILNHIKCNICHSLSLSISKKIFSEVMNWAKFNLSNNQILLILIKTITNSSKEFGLKINLLKIMKYGNRFREITFQFVTVSSVVK